MISRPPKPSFDSGTIKLFAIRRSAPRPPARSPKPFHLRAEALSGGAEAKKFELEEEEPPPCGSSDDTVTIILESIDPHIWETSDLYSVNVTPAGELLVAAPAETLARVQALLETLEQRREIDARVEFLAMDRERADKVPDAITEEAWRSLRAESGVEAEALFEFTALHGELSQQGSIRVREFVVARTAEGQPVTRALEEGPRVDARVVPSGRDRFSVSLQAGVLALSDVHTVQTGRGELRLPEVSNRFIHAQRLVEGGRPTILARSAIDAQRAWLVIGCFEDK